MSEWIETTIGSVITFQRGFDITRESQQVGIVPVVSSGGIRSYHDTAAVRGPGVVIGRKGTLGGVFYLPGDYWPHDTTLWVKDFKGSLPRFVYYFMTQFRTAWLDVGSANPTLNRNHLHPLRVLWPHDLGVQEAIAEVLGALDDKIAANTRLAELNAELTQSLYASTARCEAESVERLGDLVTTQYGVTTTAHGGSGKRLVRVTDINKKPWVEWQSTPACTVSESEWLKYRTQPGDILVARMADPGKSAFIDAGDPEAVFASYLVRLKPSNPQHALYLFYFLRSAEYRAYAESAMTGSVQKNMNAKVIVATSVTLPSTSRLTEFNSKARALRASLQSLLIENGALAATRDALLPALMSGRLRVRDAERIISTSV